jgi:hypothetical protein
VYDSGLGAQIDVEEISKKLKPSHLTRYDLVLVYDNLRFSSNFNKRRHFPFPVSQKAFKHQAELALQTTQFLIQGGKSFEIKVAMTESMSVKNAVKNIIHTLVNMSSLLIYCGQTKHNKIHEVYLSTTKSMQIPIVESAAANDSE